MTSKTETAKQLIAIATDETRPLVERIASLEQADALRKELKVGWAKLDWPYDHVTPVGYMEDLNLWLAEEKAKLEKKYGAIDWEQSSSLKRMTLDDLVPTFEESHPGEALPKDDDFEMTDEELADQALRPKADPPEPSTGPGVVLYDEHSKRPPLLLSKYAKEGETIDDAKARFDASRVLSEASPELVAQLEHQSDFVAPTVVSDAPTDNPKPEPSEEAPAPTAAERGAIGILCRDLLQTDAPYAEIAMVVRAAYPSARTTARSLASVAADMRRDGIPCPPRRKGGQ